MTSWFAVFVVATLMTTTTSHRVSSNCPTNTNQGELKITSPDDIQTGNLVNLSFTITNATGTEYGAVHHARKPNTPEVLLLGGQKSGSVSFKAKNGGGEIQIIRPPDFVVACLPLVVFPPCAQNCNSRGSCVRSKCTCEVGYGGEMCQLLVGNVSLSVAAKSTSGLYIGGAVDVTVTSDKTAAVKMNGDDFVGVYRPAAPVQAAALVWRKVPKGLATVTLTLPDEAGQYVTRLVKVTDFTLISESKPIKVNAWCRRNCTGNGRCINGSCVCNNGFDLDDCSRGKSVLNLTLVTNRDFTVNKPFEVRWWRKEWSQGIFSERDFIGVFSENDNACTDPVSSAFLKTSPCRPGEEPWVGGVVSVKVPKEGNFVVRYVRGDGVQMRQTDPFSVFPPCPSETCSGHGYCDKGECHCELGWSHVTCNNGDLSPTLSILTDPTKIHVGDPIFFQLEIPVSGNSEQWRSDRISLLDPYLPFSQNSTNISSSRMNLPRVWNYVGASRNYSLNTVGNGIRVVVVLTPVDSGMTVARYLPTLNGESVASKKFQVFPRCEQDCFGHGKCISGECACNAGWEGLGCMFSNGAVKIKVPQSTVRLPNSRSLQGVFNVTLVKTDDAFEDGDYVAVHRTATIRDSEMLVSYRFVSGAPTQHFDLTVPASLPGIYEIRYVHKGVEVETSSRFFVAPDCHTGLFDFHKLACQCPTDRNGRYCQTATCCFGVVIDESPFHFAGGKVDVTWRRPVNNGTAGDYISLNLANDEPTDAPFSWQLIGTEDSNILSRDMTFTLPEIAGVYEMRFIRRADGAVVAKSLPFAVMAS